MGFIVTKALKLEEIYGVTLLIITSSPGGAYSNWFCSIFNGDLALSVTMTAISTILSIAMLPLNVFVYSRITYGGNIVNSLDWNGLGISLAVVVTAISTGLFSSYKYDNPKFRLLANKIGNVSGLGLIMFSYFAPEGGRVNIGGRPAIFYFATPAPIVLGLIASVLISTIFRLKKPERVTVSIECCYQNTGIAITSCLTIFSGEEQRNALGVPFFYTGMQALTVGLFCLASWKSGWTKANPNDDFIKMVLSNYQDIDDGDDDGQHDVENYEHDDDDDNDVEESTDHRKESMSAI